jgi:flagellar hook-basal body complex protein FliE
MKPIAGIQPPPRPVSPFGDRRAASSQSQSASGIEAFGDLLVNQVKNVNTMQMDANDMVHSMLTGGDVNEAEVLTAVQKADLAFRMLLQVRNKLIEAYREIQQIQI